MEVVLTPLWWKPRALLQDVLSMPTLEISPVHKLLGNFLATLDFFGNFQLVEQLSMHRATSKSCVSIVTVLLLRVKQLENAEYKNIACVWNIFIQYFSFTIR